MTALQWLEEQSYPAQDQDLSCGAVLYIRKGEGRSLKAGGQWIYDNEVGHIDGHAGNGDILRILDFDGYPMGFGFINFRSKIRVRMLCRHQKDSVTPALIRKRVRDAWNYRKAVMEKNSSCCRVIFGEADFLPGITVDRFEDVLVIESLALGTDRFKLMILRELSEALAKDGIIVRGIYERSDAKVRLLEGMERTSGFIGPQFDTRVPITENGVRYIVDVKDGQKTGFFLDQKYNRAAVARIVRGLACADRTASVPDSDGPDAFAAAADHVEEADSYGISDPGMLSATRTQQCPSVRMQQGPSVLDCFTHTGSFGLNAALAGAGNVLSVDASETAISQAAENAKLNGFQTRDAAAPASPGIEDCAAETGTGTEMVGYADTEAGTQMSGHADTKTGTEIPVHAGTAGKSIAVTNGHTDITYLTADVFELLPKLEDEGKTFDFVILDPPAFAKSRQSVKNAVKGYREINLRGMRLTRNGGFLATCSCSHFMDEELFKKTLKEAAHGARKRLRQVEFRTQACDHPILWGDCESYYLKFFIFQVLDEL